MLIPFFPLQKYSDFTWLSARAPGPPHYCVFPEFSDLLFSDSNPPVVFINGAEACRPEDCVIKGAVVPVGLWFSAMAGFVRRFSVVLTEEGLLLTSGV